MKDLSAVLWQCQNAELGPLLGEIDALARAAEAGRVAVAEEALERGDARSSPRGPPRAWVEHWAPSFHAGGAGRLLDVARELRKDINTPLRASVVGGRCSAASAAVVMKEMDRIHNRLVPDAVPAVMTGWCTWLRLGGRATSADCDPGSSASRTLIDSKSADRRSRR